MDIPLKTRFAPSPTGLMHFGNLRTALFNYLYAHHQGGALLLRIEDTDTGRSETHFRDAILRDLQWLGLEWQEGPFYQSERQAIYNDYYERLQQAGRVYPCFCTDEQLAITRKVQLASHQPPRYPGTCRRLTAEQIEAKSIANIPFTLRFEVANQQVVEFQDLIKGNQRFETDHIGDFIIRRGDGSASFMFCNAIDDALMGISHALRGDDHLTNTPRQILILQALNLPIPQYGHFPTILGPDGQRLSKRNGSRSIQELRQEGFLAFGILNYLARLGHHDADNTLLDLNGLSAHFELKNISLSPAHYDPIQLNFWQKEAMHHSSWQDCWQDIRTYVETYVPESSAEAFVEMVKPNLVMPGDAIPWAKAIFADIDYEDKPEVMKVIRDAGVDFYQTASTILGESLLDYPKLVSGLQQKTGLKGKALFFPLRAALTAELHGPELAKILKLLGVEKAQARLAKAVKYASHL